MLDLKRGRISHDDRVHNLWQADSADVPGGHLDHRDFPFEVRLGNDPSLDFGDLLIRPTRPEKETQRTKSAKPLHCPPLRTVSLTHAACLLAVSRRIAR